MAAPDRAAPLSRKVRGPRAARSSARFAVSWASRDRCCRAGRRSRWSLRESLLPSLGGAGEPVRVGDNTQARGGAIAGGDCDRRGGRAGRDRRRPHVRRQGSLRGRRPAGDIRADTVHRGRHRLAPERDQVGIGQIESRRARLPIGVVVDLEFVGRSSPERVRAGLGDLLANRSAVRDWRLAAAAGADHPPTTSPPCSPSPASQRVYRNPTSSSLAAGEPSEGPAGAPARRAGAERAGDGDRRFVAALLGLGAPRQPRDRSPLPRYGATRRAGRLRLRARAPRLQGEDWLAVEAVPARCRDGAVGNGPGAGPGTHTRRTSRQRRRRAPAATRCWTSSTSTTAALGRGRRAAGHSPS